MSVEDKEKIVIRSESLPGLDLSIYDYSYAFSNKVAWTTIVKKPYKKYGKSFIGLKDNLNVGDIIQSRKSCMMYKIQKFVKMEDRYRVYKIARTDGLPFVDTDFRNLTEKTKLKIKNRGNDGLFDREEWRENCICKDTTGCRV